MRVWSWFFRSDLNWGWLAFLRRQNRGRPPKFASVCPSLFAVGRTGLQEPLEMWVSGCGLWEEQTCRPQLHNPGIWIDVKSLVRLICMYQCFSKYAELFSPTGPCGRWKSFSSWRLVWSCLSTYCHFTVAMQRIPHYWWTLRNTWGNNKSLTNSKSSIWVSILWLCWLIGCKEQ